MVKDNSEKRRPIDKATRDAVWIKYMGDSTKGVCYCCGIRPIHFTEFHVGHNKAVVKGGNDNISNLRPICSPCNTGMKTMSIEQYKKKYYVDNPSNREKQPTENPLRLKRKKKQISVMEEMEKSHRKLINSF